MNIIEQVREILTRFPRISEICGCVHVDFADPLPTSYGLSSTGDTLLSEDILGSQKRQHTFLLYTTYSGMNDYEKAEICLRLLFIAPENIPEKHLEEALLQSYAFLERRTASAGEAFLYASAGQSRVDSEAKLFDWKHDEQMIFAAVNRAAGFEVRSCRYLHWWTFLGYFGEMQEGLFTTVLHLRQKMADKKPLEKWEKEFVRKNQELVILRTAEEQAEIDETNAFLDKLLGGGSE